MAKPSLPPIGVSGLTREVLLEWVNGARYPGCDPRNEGMIANHLSQMIIKSTARAEKASRDEPTLPLNS